MGRTYRIIRKKEGSLVVIAEDISAQDIKLYKKASDIVVSNDVDLTAHQEAVATGKRIDEERLQKLSQMANKTSIYDWDWDKLPKEEHQVAIDAYNNNDVDKMVYLHNYYELSSNVYCCTPEKAMRKYYKSAITKNLISGT